MPWIFLQGLKDARTLRNITQWVLQFQIDIRAARVRENAEAAAAVQTLQQEFHVLRTERDAAIESADVSACCMPACITVHACVLTQKGPEPCKTSVV